MNLDTQTEADVQRLRLELRLKQLEKVEACQKEFLPFVRAMWPDFIAGRHLYLIAEKMEIIATGS